MPNPSHTARAVSFIQTLVKDPLVKWPIIEQAITLMADNGSLELKPIPSQWSEGQRTLFYTLAATFIHKHKREAALDELVGDIPCRIHYQNDYFVEPQHVEFLIDTFGKEALTSPLPLLGGNSVAHWRASTVLRNTHSIEWWRLLPMVETLGLNAFADWKNTHHNGHSQSFVELVSGYMAREDKERQQQWSAILAEGNANVATSTLYGKPLVATFCTPQLWDLYLAQGGNPDVVVEDNEEHLPLWSAILKRSGRKSELYAHVRAWADSARSEDASAFVQQVYFKRLKEECRWGSPRMDSLKNALTSQPNWMDFVDEEGRTALMVAFPVHQSAYKLFTAKKHAAYAAKRDNKGYNALVYALAPSSKAKSSESLAVLFDNPQVMTLGDDGKGILLQLHEQQTAFASGRHYRRPSDAQLQAQHTRAWFGDETSQQKLASVVFDVYHSTLENRSLHKLLRDDLEQITSPDLLGALAFVAATNLNRLTTERAMAEVGNAVVDYTGNAVQTTVNTAPLDSQIEWTKQVLAVCLERGRLPDGSSSAHTVWSKKLPDTPPYVVDDCVLECSYDKLVSALSRNALTQELGTTASLQPKGRKL